MKRFNASIRGEGNPASRSGIGSQQRTGGVVVVSQNGLPPQANASRRFDLSAPRPDREPVLVLSQATKTFGSVRALEDGSITLYPGEAHALLGENGAGKSTVVKILAGVHHLDTGTLTINGTPMNFSGPTASRAAGIVVIYQEPTLFPDLSVAENIFMGRHPIGSLRRIDRAQMRARSAEVFERLGVSLDPARPARGLSVADQQIVEIAKAISFDARVIVMDEPTAALSSVEVDRLFEVVKTLRADNADQRLTGKGIAFGCVGQRREAFHVKKMAVLDEARRFAKSVSLTPKEAERHGIPLNKDGQRRTAYELLSYNEIDIATLARAWPQLATLAPNIAEQIEIDAKYEVYLSRQAADVESYRRDESVTLPDDLDYATLTGLSNEARHKLSTHRPRTIGQAGRIEGITPAALTLLAAHLRRGGGKKPAAKKPGVKSASSRA